MGEIIGYIRVSTAEQNTARQEAALSEYGCQKLFVDKMSGKERNRPQLEAMLNYIREVFVFCLCSKFQITYM